MGANDKGYHSESFKKENEKHVILRNAEGFQWPTLSGQKSPAELLCCLLHPADSLHCLASLPPGHSCSLIMINILLEAIHY